jgi:hypothetical protein
MGATKSNYRYKEVVHMIKYCAVSRSTEHGVKILLGIFRNIKAKGVHEL